MVLVQFQCNSLPTLEATITILLLLLLPEPQQALLMVLQEAVDLDLVDNTKTHHLVRMTSDHAPEVEATAVHATSLE